jgi:hypothetical protein
MCVGEWDCLDIDIRLNEFGFDMVVIVELALNYVIYIFN